MLETIYCSICAEEYKDFRKSLSSYIIHFFPSLPFLIPFHCTASKKPRTLTSFNNRHKVILKCYTDTLKDIEVRKERKFLVFNYKIYSFHLLCRLSGKWRKVVQIQILPTLKKKKSAPIITNRRSCFVCSCCCCFLSHKKVRCCDGWDAHKTSKKILHPKMFAQKWSEIAGSRKQSWTKQLIMFSVPHCSAFSFFRLTPTSIPRTKVSYEWGILIPKFLTSTVLILGWAHSRCFAITFMSPLEVLLGS